MALGQQAHSPFISKFPEIVQRALAATPQNRLLDLCDRARYLDAARAGFGAVEGGAATPHALFVVEDV